MIKAQGNDYGLIAKLFHWLLAALIFWQLFTGINLNGMEFSSQKAMFIWFHQISGTLLFTLIALRLIWRLYNRPKFDQPLPQLHSISSKAVQTALYILCLWVQIQGSLMTWAGGFDVYIVGLIQLPRLIAENKDMDPAFVQVHFFSSVALLVLTVLHVGAGLYHRLVIQDKFRVWARMTFRFRKGS